jgi:LysM repeat protein
VPAAAPAPLAPSAGGLETYTVTTGDTLSEIAARYSVDVDALATANHLTDINVLVPGAQLLIPTGVLNAQNAPSLPSQQPGASPAQRPAQASAPVPARAPTSRAASTASSSVFSTATPEDTVRSFYTAVAQGKFDQAIGLWSQRMRSAYPPAQNVNSRFAATQSLTVTRADVTQLDVVAGRATVAVRLTEVVGAAPSLTRQYVGTWCLVRGSDGGWLLDQPDLQQT